MVKIACSALLASVALAASGSAWAADTAAVGLVLRAGGAVTPPMSSYTEVFDGATMALGPDAKVTFLHYESCRQLTVANGRVTILKQDVVLADGARVDKETPDKCPAELRVKPTGVAGGVRMRALNLEPPPTLPIVPNCQLIGPQADKFTGASVSSKGGLQVAMAISGGRLAWPRGQPSLQDGGSYTINLQPLPGGAPYKAAFIAKSGTDPSAEEAAPCLLRVD